MAKRSHGLDVSILFKLYDNIAALKLDKDVSEALKNSLASLETENKLK